LLAESGHQTPQGRTRLRYSAGGPATYSRSGISIVVLESAQTDLPGQLKMPWADDPIKVIKRKRKPMRNQTDDPNAEVCVQVMISEKQKSYLLRESRKRGITFSELVRLFLEEVIQNDSAAKRT
jgi:hypothetical protein